MFEIYLDPDEPHVLRCFLRYAIEVTFDGARWWRWRNPLNLSGSNRTRA